MNGDGVGPGELPRAAQQLGKDLSRCLQKGALLRRVLLRRLGLGIRPPALPDLYVKRIPFAAHGGEACPLRQSIRLDFRQDPVPHQDLIFRNRIVPGGEGELLRQRDPQPDRGPAAFLFGCIGGEFRCHSKVGQLPGLRFEGCWLCGEGQRKGLLPGGFRLVPEGQMDALLHHDKVLCPLADDQLGLQLPIRRLCLVGRHLRFRGLRRGRLPASYRLFFRNSPIR